MRFRFKEAAMNMDDAVQYALFIDARFDHLVALKMQYEGAAAKESCRQLRQKMLKLAAIYNDMAREEMKKAAANRGPEV
jgi:hypothetical protein